MVAGSLLAKAKSNIEASSEIVKFKGLPIFLMLRIEAVGQENSCRVYIGRDNQCNMSPVNLHMEIHVDVYALKIINQEFIKRNGSHT